jgi:hypothetical protein
MNWACRAHEARKKWSQIIENLDGNESPWRRRHVWKDNIKMDLKQIILYNVGWISGELL